MNSNTPEVDRAPVKSLWTRAPLWRACLSVAVLLSVGVVSFLPTRHSVDTIPSPEVPRPALRDPQQFKAPPGPAAIQAPVAEVVPAAVAQAPASTVPKPASAEAKSKTPAAIPTADSGQTAQAPVHAHVVPAAPGPAIRADSSGLDSPLVGRTYRQSIEIEGFMVPLPPGQWAVLANSSGRLHGTSGVAYFLGRIEQRRLVGAIRLFAVRSDELPGTGFPAANGCRSGNPDLNYLALEEVTPYGHQACWLINNFFASPLQQWEDRALRMPALDRLAGRDLSAKGMSFPQDFVDVRFTRAETWGLLEVSYLFDPELDGIESSTSLSASESDWHAPNVGRFPDKVAYLAKMRDWGEGLWPRFKLAFASGEQPSVRP
ncbi:hypothetical protein AB3X91_19020 [Paraburkholderia sp. BR14263]|uniref:hypothetical protein n=1 Tax=unclassified Paraburkholderia TaxID=2615204 RepID=UPI0034CF7B5F